MNATFTKQLTGLLLTLGLLLNALALPLYASTQPSPRRPSADKSRAGLSAGKPGSQTVATETARQTKEQASEAYGKLPVSFEANRGQTDPSVKFMARGNGYDLFLTATGAVLSLRKDASENQGRKLSSASSHAKASSLRSDVSSSTASLRMQLVGANADPHVSGQEQLSGKINYLTGSNRGDWHGDVPNFAKVKYEQVYPGVDMVYYGNQRQLEYDFVLAPGANPNLIKLAFEGTRQPRIAANGDLLLRTSIGEIRQHQPVAYQETDGTRQTIVARYVIKNGRVGFQVADYDHSQPLVIDPILSYSTYLGGSGSYEVSFSVAVDADGNAYVAGTTASADYPLTPGALQPAVGGNNSEGDAFVTKLNATGTALVYSTSIGASSATAFDLAPIPPVTPTSAE